MAAERSFPAPGALDPGDRFWLEAMADAVLILSPRYGRRGLVMDFRVDYANAAGTDLANGLGDGHLRPGSLIGTGFLNEASMTLVAAFRDVLETDVPRAIDALRYRLPTAGAQTEPGTWIDSGMAAPSLPAALRSRKNQKSPAHTAAGETPESIACRSDGVT